MSAKEFTVGIRVDAELVAAIDRARGGTPTSAWVRRLIERELMSLEQRAARCNVDEEILAVLREAEKAGA